MSPVIIYTTSWCPYCQTAKDYLSKKGVAFEEKNIEINLGARDELVQKSSQLGVPAFDIGGKILVGFSADEIDAALVSYSPGSIGQTPHA